MSQVKFGHSLFKYLTAVLSAQCGTVVGIGMEYSSPQGPWTTLPRYGILNSRSPYKPSSHLTIKSYRGVCVSTLRGHADSVNALSFMTYSNTLLTTSADKTVSMWDLRTVSHNVCMLLMTFKCFFSLGPLFSDILWTLEQLQ